MSSPPIARRLQRAFDADTRLGLALLAPAALIIGFVLLVPIATALFMAFNSINLQRSPNWTFNGLNNFALLGRDDLALAAIPRSIYFASLTVVLVIVASVGVAIVLNEPFRGRRLVRLLALIPWSVAPLAAGSTWYLLFYYSYGGINAVLYALGIIPEYISWLTDATLAINAAVIGQVWLSIPLASLLILARLQGIPGMLYKAAMVDGATAFQRFRYITLPGLRTTLLIVILITTIISLQTFDLIFALTRGGPALGTVVLNYAIYQRAFVDLRIGYAASLALILFGIVLIASLAVLILTRQRRQAQAYVAVTE